MISEIDRKAFKEAYVILQFVEDNQKIPKEIIEILEENMDKEYEYKMNSQMDINEQPMLEETKAILYNIMAKYLSEDWQKEKIKQRTQNYIKKIEQEKQNKYNSDIFQNKEIKPTIKKEMIEHKENIIVRIINKIKKYLKK